MLSFQACVCWVQPEQVVAIGALRRSGVVASTNVRLPRVQADASQGIVTTFRPFHPQQCFMLLSLAMLS
jgi:hypothetical protein